MKQGPRPAQRAGGAVAGALIRGSSFRATVRRRSARVCGVLALCAALAGCRHNTQWVPPNVMTAPVPLEMPAASSYAPELATIPPPEYIPLEEAQPFPRVVRKRPTPPAKDANTATPAPQPAESAPVEAPELALGSLSAGGESGPQNQQQARDLIAGIQRRVAALPRNVSTQDRNQLRQVTSFLKRAQQALESGDAEGSVNLATKARVIMDDIEKH